MKARGTDSAKVIQVIVTTALKGEGTEKDPVRIVTQYWDFKGNLLAEADRTTSLQEERQLPHTQDQNL